MDAIISGQASLDIMTEGDSNYLLRLDDDEPRPLTNTWEASILLRDAGDLRRIRNTTIDDIKQELEAAWSEDRCLHMVLILLDPSVHPSTRDEAADYANDLLASPRTESFVANRLYADVLPPDSCIIEATRASKEKGWTRLHDLLFHVERDQAEVGRRVQAWDDLDLALFDSLDAKVAAKVTFRNAGAFKVLVQERLLGSSALLQLYINPAIRRVKNYRDILKYWTLPFGEAVSGPSYGTIEEMRDCYEPVHERGIQAYRRASLGAAEALSNVSKQKDVIKDLLSMGNRERARDYIEQLVESQRRTGTNEHIAMSLCDLAQFAGELGDIQLELELCEWATVEAPEDSWAWAQLGDAQRKSSQFQKALGSFDRVKLFGEEKIALMGRASVLKDSGSLREALEVYQFLQKAFPDDPVPWTAYASALADFGRLQESLTAYDEAIRRFPMAEYPVSGKAQVFRDMGRYRDAEEVLDRADQTFGPRAVNDTMRAQIYRETNRLDEAHDLFQRILEQADTNILAHNGLAMTLRDMRRFDESLQVYSDMMRRFVMDPLGYLGRASILKLMGRLSDSLSAYDDALSRFPGHPSAVNGKASVLAYLGKYTEALQTLPETEPATFNEWLSYYLRGLIFLKRDDFEKAIGVFATGLDRTPWSYPRHLFKTSLSLALVRKSELKQAETLLAEEPPPSLIPIRQIIKMTICAANHDWSSGLRFSERLDAHREARAILDSREILLDILSGQRPFSASSADIIFRTECDALLGVAA